LSDDDDMPRARPQFVHLSESEVWKAIAEDAGGSVGAEVTRLVAELTIRLMARAGHEVWQRFAGKWATECRLGLYAQQISGRLANHPA
jgi:hypothetical protein